jgi:LmbE family N-acetylglucosaminyl deacetylase
MKLECSGSLFAQQVDVLIIAAHPDDAELAVGGTIASLVASSNRVAVVNVTVSESDEAAKEERVRAAQESAKILGCSVGWMFDAKLNQVDEIRPSQLVREIDAVVDQLQPKVVISHAPHDSHVDHVLTYNAVLASSRRWRCDWYSFGKNERRVTEALEFSPNVYVNITEFLDKKRKALECYCYERSNSSLFRSLDIEANSVYNAYLGTFIGVKSAEAFRVIRRTGI